MNLILADKNARLYNYVVDIFSISIIIFFAFFFIMMGWNAQENLIYYSVCFLGYYGYYFLLEWKTGKTLGKHLTNTLVTDKNGEPPKFFQLLIRTLARVPVLDGLYFLLSSEIGLHDWVSGTRVVKRK